MLFGEVTPIGHVFNPRGCKYYLDKALIDQVDRAQGFPMALPHVGQLFMCRDL